MALPALRAIKKRFPHDNIYLVTRHYLNDIFKNIAEINEVITIPDKIGVGNIFKVAGKLKKYRFRLGILFTNSFRSSLLFRLAGINNLFVLLINL